MNSKNCLCLNFICVVVIFFSFTVVTIQAADLEVKSIQNSKNISIVDDTGYTLELIKPAERIIGLYGALSELVLALGEGDRLVGRTVADMHIEQLKHLPAIGTHMRPNPELIMSLKPDVVLQFLGRQEANALGLGLRKLGVPVLIFRLQSFEDMFSVLLRLGKLTGNEQKAIDLVSSYRKRIGDLRNVLVDEKRVSVFYEVRYPNLLGAGPKSIVTDIIDIAGGRNVITISERVVRLSEEELLHKNPMAYIIQKGPMNPDPIPLSERPHFATLQAVKDNKILIVSEFNYARPGPRAVDAVEELARWLHPKVNFNVKIH